MSAQLTHTIKTDVILIASSDIEDFLVDQLRSEFNLHCANTKEEALLVLSQHKTNLVLIEQKTLCDIVRAELFKEGFNVILLTPTPSFNEGIEALQHGYRGYGNLYSHRDRMIAAINLVKAGDVWLGASIVEGLKQGLASSNTAALNQLTPKEVSVAKEVITGISNKEIASNLNISERTVKAHLSAIYEKLSIKNRTELILNYKNSL